jgi:hypothetical protein
MTELKLKKGDVAIVVANKSKHKFNIGQHVVIHALVIDGYKAIIEGTTFDASSDGINWWYVNDDDLIKYGENN